VVNYDLPDETEAYVHRIGRTGRMGRSGVAWSLVTANDVLQLDRISSTWNLKIPSSQPPELPKGVSRDPVRKREDWDEVSDSFGMVRIRVSVGRKEASKREFSDWLKAEAKLPDIAIGDILQEDHSAIIEIHVEKAGATLEILKRREWEGSSLEPELLDRPAVEFNRAYLLA
jgi:ATP-dependent RNA helicase DeaD